MGWLTMPQSSMGGHATAKAYLDNQFTYEREQDDGSRRGLTVLASSCPGNRVYYAAVQVIAGGQGGEIFAIICLIRWNPRAKDGYVFGYKDMDESMGPCEADCPAHILDLLTPTDKEYARDWRARCRANLELRSRKLADGDRIRLSEPMTFRDGSVLQEFIVVKHGRRVILRHPERAGQYRISRLMERSWTLVPTTKIHKTLFS